MKSFLKVFLVIICFFLIVIFFTKPFSSKIDEHDSNDEFRLVIVKITKTARNYDYIVLSNGKIYINIIDRLRRSKNYQIAIGDSLIKEKNTCNYFYKRKDSIIYFAKDACKTIFRSSQ